MTVGTQAGRRLDYEPGSYRDRDGRVFYDGGRVLRALSPHALSEWNHVSRTAFFQTAMQRGRIVHSEDASADVLEADLLPDGWAGVLRHDAIPFVSYPYEWTFGMLRDAAILQL